MKLKALVIGEDTRSFLSVVRSLAKNGYTVEVVCLDKNSPSVQSKYINEVFFYNYQAYTHDDFLNALFELAQQRRYDLIVPCDERSIFPLHNQKHKFEALSKLAIPNKKVIEHLFDKHKTKVLAAKLNIPIAADGIYKIKNESFSKLKKKFGANFVLKPTASFKEDNLSTRQQVLIVENQAMYEDYIRYLTPNDEFLIEEYFTGRGEGVSVFAVNGKIQYAFAHTRVNEPRTGGGSSYRKSIAVDAGMLDACVKLCEETAYSGVGMFEFKKNEENGKWILIEVNARFWGSLPLAIYAGIDFPLIYANWLVGKTAELDSINTRYRLNRYARSFTSDLYDIKSELEFNLTHHTKLKSLFSVSKRLFAFLRLIYCEKIDSFDWRDTKPFITEVKQFFAATLMAKLRIQRAKSPHDEMQRLLRHLHVNPSVNIKFVCYGNIMRSPLAKEALALLCKQVDLPWSIDSFGFHQIEERSSPIECLEQASNIGIDLNIHRSKCLRQKHIDEETDLVIVFDSKNIGKLRSYYKLENIYNLADFIPLGLGRYDEISDPYGQGSEATAKCYLLIVEALKNIFEQYLKIRPV